MNDGGPAFPVRVRVPDINRYGEAVEVERPGPAGLTIRDFFAATCGDDARAILDQYLGSAWGETEEEAIKRFARLKFAIADAMLVAREGGATIAPCKSCGSPMIWTKTGTGKSIQLDPDPVPNGNIVLHADGTAMYITKAMMNALDPEAKRYVSHFATCPNAAQHRKEKRS
jgi:hypothetical protein